MLKSYDKFRPILSLRSISKSFGANSVLKGVSIDFHNSEVTGLIGVNGAGKSTLMKIISGNLRADSGEVIWKGKRHIFKSAADAYRAGIYMIPQELGLVKDLNAIENILLGKEPHQFGFWKSDQAIEVVTEALRKVGAKIPLDVPVYALSPGEQQQIAITRSLVFDAELLILDEPTSMLTESEAERLFEIISELKLRGRSIIYITHRLGELQNIADRVIGLRDGNISGQGSVDNASSSTMVKWMVGDAFAEADQAAEKHFRSPHSKEVLLKVENIRSKTLKGISFEVHRGEILGLMGLMGSGRTEILRAIAGVDSIDRGRILVDGVPVKTGSVADAMSKGIFMSPEDRRRQGLLLDQSCGFNSFLQNSDKFSKFGFLPAKAEAKAFAASKEKIHIDILDHWLPAACLSGGNQQRLILGNVLLSDAQILLLDEITTGVDVMTKAQILAKVVRLAEEGRSIIFVSSDWEEVTEISDRVLVIQNGRIISQVPRTQFDDERILSMIVHSQTLTDLERVAN